MTAALSTALTIAVFAAFALHPPKPRHSAPFTLQFAFSWWMNDSCARMDTRRRVRNRRYGPARRGNLVDVYVSRRRARASAAPTLVYLHGGGGDKAVFAHALMYQLAARGWVCVSANYRLYGVSYLDQLADARAALCWAQSNAEHFGADPSALFVAGGSLGANVAATAALTGAHVKGAIGLYGYYGATSAGPPPTSPHDAITEQAPPFLIIHGALDALVRVDDARAFAHNLATVSGQPVAYAELPGANHNFDFFPSLRCRAIGDAMARFMELAMKTSARRLTPPSRSEPPDATSREGTSSGTRPATSRR